MNRKRYELYRVYENPDMEERGNACIEKFGRSTALNTWLNRPRIYASDYMIRIDTDSKPIWLDGEKFMFLFRENLLMEFIKSESGELNYDDFNDLNNRITQFENLSYY